MSKRLDLHAPSDPTTPGSAATLSAAAASRGTLPVPRDFEAAGGLVTEEMVTGTVPAAATL